MSNITPQTRLRIMKRDKFLCIACGATQGETELEVDHVVPRAKGGSDDDDNLQTLCQPCNRGKGVGELKKRAPRGNIATKHVKESLIGMFLHTHEEDHEETGLLKWQAQIIGRDGEDCILQLFDWDMGFPGSAALIAKAELFDRKKVTLYAEHEDWVSVSDRHTSRRIQLLKEKGEI
jgi:5-methylcytosine-specific restriction enzyme A